MLLNIFVKKTPAIPTAEIDLAQSRWEDFRARMNATSKGAANERPATTRPKKDADHFLAMRPRAGWALNKVFNEMSTLQRSATRAKVVKFGTCSPLRAG